MKKWDIVHKLKIKNEKLKIAEVIDALLENRGLKTKEEIEAFLHPTLELVTVDSVGIDKKQLKKTLKRIEEAIEKKEQIIVFGDYDVDGISGTAILWETLHELGANALPYIPHRVDEGYGLSIKGIQNVQSHPPAGGSNIKLIITVDNGIVAHEAVEFANKQGIDVIITDHHVVPEVLPKAFAIVHTTKVCGTSVAYLLSKEIIEYCHPGGNEVTDRISNKKDSIASLQNDKMENDHLALVALATVADLVPLKDANRALLYHGLPVLRNTKRIGLQEICKEAAIDQKTIDTYAIGHVIAPRLNAAGRLEYAMDALRLLCTKNKERAVDMAMKLGQTNKERQQLTIDSVLHAKDLIKTNKWEANKLFFISHEIYEQGIVGLIAGRIVEEYYRPAIVLSVGEKYSKASARSIHGFNIIEFIRSVDEHLVNAGGHPMAAGFTVETAKLTIIQKLLEEKAGEILNEDMLTRTLKIDCELPLSFINQALFDALQQLAPFGMGNQEPVFMSSDVIVDDIRIIGKDRKHVKLRLACHPELDSGSQQGRREIPDQVRNDTGMLIEGIGFGMAEQTKNLKPGDKINIAYTIDENEWNGQKKLQLKIKDIKVLNSD